MASRVRGGQRLKRFINQAKAAKTVKGVEIGFFETAKYPDGTPVASVAAWNEFGTERNGKEHVPERPFFRKAIKAAETELKPILRANLDPKTMAVERPLAGKLGSAFQKLIQQSITILRDPPNAPSTKQRKGSSNPLINTGTMRRSVTWRILD